MFENHQKRRKVLHGFDFYHRIMSFLFKQSLFLSDFDEIFFYFSRRNRQIRNAKTRILTVTKTITNFFLSWVDEVLKIIY